MKMRFSYLVAGLAFLAQPVAAQDVQIVRDFELQDPILTRYSDACIDALTYEIAPVFEGLSEITLATPHIVDMDGGKLRILVFSAAYFKGPEAPVEGTVMCSIHRGMTSIAEIATVFVNEGLGGYTAHPLAGLSSDKSQLRASQHVVSLEN